MTARLLALALLRDEDLDQHETPPPDDEGDDDEVDNLSNWNVPSWNDLIASLYRPER